MNEIVTLVDYLQRNKVPFALTGAPAMAAWGYGRASADIDFVVVVSERNYKKVREFGKRRNLTLVSDTPDQITLRDEGVLFDYDFLFTTNAIVRAMYENSAVKHAFGKRFRVVRAEDIILGKLFRMVVSYNLDDARDIIVLASITELDIRYLREKIKKSKELLQPLKKAIKNADQLRYKDFDLGIGAARLSACL
jgi:hypothetical protein